MLAVFYYVLILMVISEALGFGLDYYKFRLEHQFHLSNQKFKSWLLDEAKGWLIGLVIATVLVEMIYNIVRFAPSWWWLIVWVTYNLLAIFFAQIAPVVVFPLFYKFRPLENDDLRQRLIKLSQKAGTRVRGVYEWQLSEKSKKANAALAGVGATRRIILSDTLLQNFSPDEIEAVLAHELGHHVYHHIRNSISGAGWHFVRRILCGCAHPRLLGGSRLVRLHARLCERAVTGVADDRHVVSADADPERLLAKEGTAGRPIFARIHPSSSAVYQLDE